MKIGAVNFSTLPSIFIHRFLLLFIYEILTYVIQYLWVSSKSV